MDTARLVECLKRLAPNQNVRLVGEGHVTSYWRWLPAVGRHVRIPKDELATAEEIASAQRQVRERSGLPVSWAEAEKLAMQRKAQPLKPVIVNISQCYRQE